MFSRILKVKFQELTVSESSIEYPGSISIPAELLSSTGLHEFEQVYINNKTNGNRISTYVIKNNSSNRVTVNGAASKLFTKNDKIHVLVYTYIDDQTLTNFSPKLVITDEDNKLIEIKNYRENNIKTKELV